MPKPAWVAIAVLGLVAAVLPVVALSGGRGGPGAARGRQLPDQGQQHITEFDTHPPYNSAPPTSGWHLAEVAPWGVLAEPIPDVLQVHDLEHGGVLVQYNCPTPCEALVRQLAAVVERYPSKVILAPYPPMTPKVRADRLDLDRRARRLRRGARRRVHRGAQGQGPGARAGLGPCAPPDRLV